MTDLFPQLQASCKPRADQADSQHMRDGVNFSFLDDVKTVHWKLFEQVGGVPGYRYSREQTVAELRQFVGQSLPRKDGEHEGVSNL